MHEGEYHYYDKVRINSTAALSLLKERLPISELTDQSYCFKIMQPSKGAYKWGSKSKIEVVAPTMKFLELLLQYESDLRLYKISYLEITKDEFCQTERDADIKFFETIRFLRKKYTANHQVYPELDSDDVGTAPIRDKSLFGDHTSYYGSRNYRLVIYPRLSKINGSPCFHSEWRLQGAQTIKRKTGILNIRDLISFDQKRFHEEQKVSQLVYESIDTFKLGKWLMEWSRRRKFTARQEMRIYLASFHFCNAYGIRSYADLAGFLWRKRKG